MLLCFGNQAEAEINGLIRQAVLFNQLGTAAVGADTILLVVKAQDSAAGLFQLEIMTLVGQLFLGVVRCVEAETLGADDGHAKVFAFQNSVVAIAVGAVLLGTDVILMQAGDGVGEQAVPNSIALVHIVLDGAQAVVSDIFQTLGQEHSQAKAGQLGELGVPLCQNVHGNSAGDTNGPIQLDIDELLDGGSSDGHIGVDSDFVFGGNEVGVVGSGHHVIVVGCHPVQLQLPVVVSGGSPDIEVHGLVQEFLAIEGHLGEHAGELIVLVSKGAGADGNVTVAFGGGDGILADRLCLPDLQGSLVAAICVGQENLIEAQVKALGEDLGGVLQLVGDLQVAAALFRNLDAQRNGAVAVRSNCGNLLDLAAGHDLTVAAHFVSSGDVVRQADEIHIVVDSQLASLGIIGFYTDRTMNILIFHQAGAGGSVGINQTVDAEVAVVGPLTAVAAVQVLCLAVLCDAGVDCVITPFPDEAAAHDVVILDELPVVFQVAGAVAHGVCVFAHQEGLVGVGVQIPLQALHGGVHIAVQVDVGEVVLALAAAVLRAFVVGQAGGIKVLGPCQSRLEAAAVGAFVTHGPADDGGTVLITLDAALGAVHGSFQEVRVICKGLVPGLYVVLPDVIFLAVQSGSAMAFVVCFVDDHEAVLVTQLIEHGRVGVVAGADCVKVILLDHSQIPLHVLYADNRAGNGIGVVTVDTAELDGVAVQEHHVVLNVDLPEANAVGDDFVRGFQKQGVQIGLLGIPEDGVLHGQNCLMSKSATVLEGLDSCGCHRLVSRIEDFDLGSSYVAVVSETDPDSCLFLIQQRGGEVIADAVLRTAQDVDIAEDARGTELILIFQVAAVAPLQDNDCQGVLAFLNSLGDVELGGGVGNLAVAQVLAVQPHVEAGVNALEVQVCLGSVCILGIHKVAQIGAARILIGNKGRICRERITDVGVLVLVIAMVLPDAGDRDGIPGRSIVTLLVEEVFEVVDALAVLELPVTVEKLETVGMLTVFYQIVHPGGCRDEVRSVRGSAYMMGMQVLEVGGNDHCAFLLKTHLFIFSEVCLDLSIF